MPTAIRAYIRSLGIDAYVVGGAVRDELLGIPHRDEDFLVPGVDQAGPARAARAARPRRGHGGARAARRRAAASRRDRAVRALVPAGIDLTPPRAERSTGPGHRDFAIVSDASIELEEDMARRDFTINAMARRLDGRQPRRPVRRRRRPRAPPAAHRRPDELRGRPAPPRARPALRLAARLRPRTRDAEPDARRPRPGSPTSPPSGSEAGSRPTARASSRSSCSGRSRPARSSSRATPACSRA